MTDDDKPVKPSELFTLDKLKETVEGVVKSMFGDDKPGKDEGKKTTGDDKPRSRDDITDDISDRVRKEIEKMHALDAQATRDKEIDAVVKAHKDAKEKEKPPIERRKVHRFMGWGEP